MAFSFIRSWTLYGRRVVGRAMGAFCVGANAGTLEGSDGATAAPGDDAGADAGGAVMVTDTEEVEPGAD